MGWNPFDKSRPFRTATRSRSDWDTSNSSPPFPGNSVVPRAPTQSRAWDDAPWIPHASDVIGSNEPDAIGLGRYRDWHTGQIGPRLRFGGPEGIMLLGRNNVGKDTRILIPLLLQTSGISALVIDVKGELAAVTARYRSTISDVVIINPYGVLTEIPGYEYLRSTGFNPLLTLSSGSKSFLADCNRIATAIIVPEKGDGGGNSKYFNRSSNNYLTMAIMWEVICAEREKRVPMMTRVRELVCMASGVEITKDGNRLVYGWPALARKLLEANVPALGNLVGQFTSWTKEKDSIASDAMSHTAAFDDNEIATDLVTGTFDFRDMKKRPVTVYVVLPPLDTTRQASYLRLIVSTALRAVMRVRYPGEPKCLFVLNEFPTLGKLDILTDIWGAVRGYGIQLMPILQSYSQLTDIYGDDAATTFAGQAGVVASFGASDLPTARWLSERCGDTTVVLAGYNQNQQMQGAGGSSGLNWGQVKVPAVTPHEMLDMRDGNMIQFRAGLANFVSAYAPPYWRIDQCQQRADQNPYYSPRALM